VSALTEAAAPESQIPADSGTPKRRRRWPFILIACVTALIVTAGGIAFWWVATRYAPIRANTTAASRVRVESGKITRVPAWDATRSSGYHFVAFLVPYRDGKWLDAEFTLVNDSPFPVAVDEIGFPGSGDPIRQISVSMNASALDWGPVARERMVPFRPFTIPSHGGRYFVVRYQFSGCSLDPKAEDPVLHATQMVRFRMKVGGVTIHRADFLPLGYSIGIVGTEGCPG